jgi:DNA/RNA endonuclease G (NUC1)
MKIFQAAGKKKEKKVHNKRLETATLIVRIIVFFLCVHNQKKKTPIATALNVT